jgi:hypothetical protein
VIVLDHNFVGQADSMTLAAAGNDRGHVECPKSRSGLPSMEDPAAGAAYGLDVRPGGCRDAAGALKQVENWPFGLQNRSELSPEPADNRSRTNCAPVLVFPGGVASAGTCHRIGKASSGKNATVTVFDSAFGLHSGGNDEGGCDVYLAVFAQSRGRYPLGVGLGRQMRMA